MELFSVAITGFRRFRNRVHLRTNGKVLALVGPNEAGKSTILDALASLNDHEPIDDADVTRGSDPAELLIIGRFLLDQEEAELARLPTPTWLRVHKGKEGGLTYGFDPPAPARDLSHRPVAIEAIRRLLDEPSDAEEVEKAVPGLAERLRDACSTLADAEPDLAPAILEELRDIGGEMPAEGVGAIDPEVVREAREAWLRLVELELAPNPHRHAIGELLPRVPKFLLFDEGARRLASSYSVSRIRSEMPPALSALMEVAGLDFEAVTSALDRGDRAALATLEMRANRKLAKTFTEAWRQSEVSVALRLSDAHVEVQIFDQEERFTRLGERSDGLRQFVALNAFASQAHANSPILLIDEAEQRLHYDAQADLVQMLTRQSVAPKVIYTTHSAGCLPEDLGHGVRLVEPERGDAAASTVVNKFWSRPGGGFAPLLFGLGATTLAFFPTRRAVCVEGVSDMLLLPTMLRAASGRPTLGYQFVPGLAETTRSLLPLMPAEAANVAFVVDGDGGGLDLAGKLTAAGIAADRVIDLRGGDGAALEMEDYLDPELILAAANRLIVRHVPGAVPLSPFDLPPESRMADLENAFRAATGRSVDKVELAYAVLDLVDEAPGRELLAAARRAELAGVEERIASALRLKRP